MLKIKLREYQQNIVNSILANGNTLVVLPTGLGKTFIAVKLIEHYLSKGQILIMAPTRPLVEQHYKTIMDNMSFTVGDGDNDNDDVVKLITGVIPPTERKKLWASKIIISTPQTVRNDIIKGNYNFSPVLCVFDEAHKTVGNYAYTYVSDKAKEAGSLILGLTASPGGDKKKIQSIIDALYINNVEVRNHNDPDVSKYVEETKIKWIHLKLSDDLKRVSNIINDLMDEQITILRKWGFTGPLTYKSQLLRLRPRIFSNKSNGKYIILSRYTSLFSLVHMKELLETQGASSLLKYIDKLKTKDSKAAARIITDRRLLFIETILKTDPEHPKLDKLVDILQNNETKQAIVFVQYRTQIDRIVEILCLRGMSAVKFVGQGKGYSQKDQRVTLERFRNNEFRILVASSVGEEGLDIPSVDLVIFYEPIGSAIRTIQRKGRAGRVKAGEVIILVTKDTQDEALYWISKKKEKKMQTILQGYSKSSTILTKSSNIISKNKNQKDLTDYF